jgi:hypothetical protein
MAHGRPGKADQRGMRHASVLNAKDGTGTFPILPATDAFSASNGVFARIGPARLELAGLT